MVSSMTACERPQSSSSWKVVFSFHHAFAGFGRGGRYRFLRRGRDGGFRAGGGTGDGVRFEVCESFGGERPRFEQDRRAFRYLNIRAQVEGQVLVKRYKETNGGGADLEFASSVDFFEILD